MVELYPAEGETLGLRASPRPTDSVLCPPPFLVGCPRWQGRAKAGSTLPSAPGWLPSSAALSEARSLLSLCPFGGSGNGSPLLPVLGCCSIPWSASPNSTLSSQKSLFWESLSCWGPAVYLPSCPALLSLLTWVPAPSLAGLWNVTFKSIVGVWSSQDRRLRVHLNKHQTQQPQRYTNKI